jgi:hypothetical protein
MTGEEPFSLSAIAGKLVEAVKGEINANLTTLEV